MSNKLIYGMSRVEFNGVEIGWFDEQGLTPAGTAATQVDIIAAQVKDGPVGTITSNPGKKAFTGNLIDMSAENLVAAIGGTKDDKGNWEPPEKWEKTGVMDIFCDSGHTIRLYKAKVTGNDFSGGVNSQGVLSVALNVEVMKDDADKRLKIFVPGEVPETPETPETSEAPDPAA